MHFYEILCLITEICPFFLWHCSFFPAVSLCPLCSYVHKPLEKFKLEQPVSRVKGVNDLIPQIRDICQRKDLGLIPMGSDLRKWRRPGSGPSYWKEAHCTCAYSTSRFKANQLERWNRSGCAVHVYATAVFICVTSCICLWIRNMHSDSLLAEPGDMKPKPPPIHLAGTRGHLKVKEVICAREQQKWVTLQGNSSQKLRVTAKQQNIDKTSNWVISFATAGSQVQPTVWWQPYKAVWWLLKAWAGALFAR